MSELKRPFTDKDVSERIEAGYKGESIQGSVHMVGERSVGL
jgi:hypothetical protein